MHFITTRRLALSTTSALCLLAFCVLPVHATIVSSGTASATVVEPSQTFSGSSSLSVAGTDSGSQAAFSVIDFNTSALGFTNQTRAASINSVSLSLTDLNTNPALATGIVDVYISTSVTPAAALSFQSANGPQGIGTQLDTLTQVANIDLSTTAGKGTTFNSNFTLSPTSQTYILNQINLGKTVRVVLAPDSSSVVGSFQGTTPAPPLTSPLLKFNVNTGTRRPGDANGDNVVDIQDLTIVVNDWQQADFGPSTGDFDDSGFVDIRDLTALVNNWQAGVGSGSGSGSSSFASAAEQLQFAASPVPEPATIAAFACGALLLISRRKPL